MSAHGPHVRRASSRGRRGSVLVEFSFVVAIASVIFFAAFEFCRVAMIRHTVDNAVYAGIRSGLVPGADATTVALSSRRVLVRYGIDDARITVTPPKLAADTQRLRLDIEVPLDANSLVATNFFQGRVIKRSLSMPREAAP